MAKVAIVSSIPIFPLIGGNRARILALSNGIAKLGHEPFFVYLPSRKEAIDVQAHAAHFGRNRFLRAVNPGMTGDFRQFIRNRFPSMLRNAIQLAGIDRFHYRDLDRGFNKAWLPQIREFVGDADVCLIEYVFNSLAFDAFSPMSKRLLDTHDSFADRHVKYATQGLRRGYWISLRPEQEEKGLRRADTVIAIQHSEAALFRSQIEHEKGGNGPEIRVVSHFLDVAGDRCDTQLDNTAVFVGSDNPANAQALAHFCDKLFPQVLARSPSFRLTVAGRACNLIPDHPNVMKLGVVAHQREAFRYGSFSISPMLAGTGISIRLLDAMAAGLPMVSTETGARGVPLEYRNGMICVADDDHAGFVDAVLGLGDSAPKREELARAALSDARRWNETQLASLEYCISGG